MANDSADPRVSMDVSESYDASVSDGDEGSITKDSSGTNQKSDEESPVETLIARNETKVVKRSKLLVYCALFLAAGGAGALTYFLTNAHESSKFESEFRGFANELSRITEASANSKFSVARSLAIATTSYAVDKNIYFPFVTVPDFELRTDEALKLSGAEVVVFLPVVHDGQVSQWEEFAQDNQGWIREGLDLQGLQIIKPGPVPRRIHDFEDSSQITAEEIENEPDEKKKKILEEIQKSYAPVWQVGRAPADAGLVNLNFLSDRTFRSLALDVFSERRALHSIITDLEFLYKFTFSSSRNFNRTFNNRRQLFGDNLAPHSYILQPVFETLERRAEIVGFLLLVVPWDTYFQNVYPENVKGVDVVLSDNCGSTYTYEINGPEGKVKGRGDLHDIKYDESRVSLVFESNSGGTILENQVGEYATCQFTMTVYATDILYSDYDTNDSIIYACVVVLIFVFTAFVFMIYDWAVQQRQRKVMKTASRTQALVSSLFPKNVQARIFEDVAQQVEREEAGRGFFDSRKDRLASFLRNGPGNDATAGEAHTKPIADLFPEATVIFADIVGFTAWSSTREPSQVFTLLETLYHHFDLCAKQRRIFKVETVGDCYVAVAGLPEPRKDHALAMARFSRDCLSKFKALVKKLVLNLGPDTEDLSIRIGLHSGPVTAGVLRGERARFQLFGDTVNTAARMESTGLPNRIQCSQETANLLIKEGKSSWIKAREDTVLAKGKGQLQTYWLENGSGPLGRSNASVTSETSQDDIASVEDVPENEAANTYTTMDKKHSRLVEWNVEILSKFLEQIVARREALGVLPVDEDRMCLVEDELSANHVAIREVVEIVHVPAYCVANMKTRKLKGEVSEQLRKYVRALASMYRSNPFHNFEHASHVTMSVLKLLSRIVAPDLHDGANTIEDLHDHTYGITSDPLTQFSVLLSALIHDVDHPGVPNSQLVREGSRMAAVYDGHSIAEQNSVDLAWGLLMEDDFKNLRRTICSTESEFRRFRQLLVNIVMATDIMDKDLKKLRNDRWQRAFAESPSQKILHGRDDIDRKATIVMEHLIQASDVAHTMQHWHIYRKWNQRLFMELYEAYLKGRAENDPSEGWYKGELGFLDFYVIPLAKKLKDCGVFGVSSDEYLQYAEQNRKEWEVKGQSIVAEMMEIVLDRTKEKQEKESAKDLSRRIALAHALTVTSGGLPEGNSQT